MMKQKTIEEILKDGDQEELYALFTFDTTESRVLVFKFNLWARYFFPKFFSSEDALFHTEIDKGNADAYLGLIDSFANIAYRGSGKTTRTKLFIAFVIANDLEHRRKYFKVLSQDGGNSKQFVTDVYNLLIDTQVKELYPEIFQKTDTKREETMTSFTTATGIKLLADTVGSAQRGQIQEDSRPDFIVNDDFETRISLRSAVTTKAIWDNMEEARTGLSKGGVSIYLCQYLSERGNVYKIIQKQSERNRVLIIPIEKDGIPTWITRYSVEDIKQIKHDADDYEGEYLCEPAKGKDIIFDRERLKTMEKHQPIKEIAGQKIFYPYNASHRYAGGADIAGGVGLDSSTSVIIDFDTLPARVVATYASNEVKPDIFGDELAQHGSRFGECLLAPENNKYDMVIGRLKQIYPLEKIYITQRAESKIQPRQSINGMEYGWNTNVATKPKMIFGLSKAIEDGILELTDPDLIAEAISYTRNDLMDSEVDPRLTTRHYDLLTALAIAWAMKDWVKTPTQQIKQSYNQPVRVSEYDAIPPKYINSGYAIMDDSHPHPEESISNPFEDYERSS